MSGNSEIVVIKAPSSEKTAGRLWLFWIGSVTFYDHILHIKWKLLLYMKTPGGIVVIPHRY